MFQTLDGHTSPVLQCAFIDNGSQLISADMGGVCKIWKMPNWQCTHTSRLVADNDDGIWTISVNQDESLVATGGPLGFLHLFVIEENELLSHNDSGVNIDESFDSSIPDFFPYQHSTPDKKRKNSDDAQDQPAAKRRQIEQFNF